MGPRSRSVGSPPVDEFEVVWHGGMLNVPWGVGGHTKGELLSPREKGSTFPMLQPANGGSADPDDRALRYNRNRVRAIERARQRRQGEESCEEW